MESVIIVAPRPYEEELRRRLESARDLAVTGADPWVVERGGSRVYVGRSDHVHDELEPEERAAITRWIANPTFYTVDFSDIHLCREILEALIDDPELLVDNDHGTRTPGPVFLSLLQQRPDWDWRRDRAPAQARTIEKLPAIRPLGIFGVVAVQKDFEGLRAEISALAGILPADERPAIAAYLRAGAVIFAIMSYSWDVIGGIPDAQLRREHVLQPGPVCGAFAVPGGLGVSSDGVWYWRADTADYVEHYGVGLPEDFLQHGRSIAWQAQPLTPEMALEVDRYLYRHAARLPAKSGEGA